MVFIVEILLISFLLLRWTFPFYIALLLRNPNLRVKALKFISLVITLWTKKYLSGRTTMNQQQHCCTLRMIHRQSLLELNLMTFALLVPKRKKKRAIEINE
ncbi:hypothetical protein SQ56_11335 [Klebsiella variicola]|nr:hypothetical protein BB778_12515 [Pluralibacter gergoviae]OVE60453.1 hypothetical protein SQ56_11335 [Klebsiella variicola]